VIEGQTIAHYRILGRIGAGAMGIVCKAQDMRLNRMVAIKYLSPETVADAQSRDRLLQEARAASQLDHPNICRIHQIEELEDGQVVLVLSYYEGETLSAQIARAPIEVGTAVKLAAQLLSGLEHAHANGVIHRDIKPSNLIVLGNGELKIVDFGLARSAGDSGQLTETGAFLGTISYMSPEQVLCEGVDHRSDIWASGVVLYEMLTGRLPFPGESPYAVFDAILAARPREAHHHRAGIPRPLSEAIARALVRDAGSRYQTAREFMTALHGIAHTDASAHAEAPAETRAPRLSASQVSNPGVRNNSLVVLPFTQLDGHTDAEYFCDGLTEEIITDLCAVRSLRTICSASSMRLKGTEETPQQIARQLRVRYVLKGTVRMGGKPGLQSIRVTSQLIDPGDDCIVWGDKYSGTLEDVFAIQEGISRQIVKALRLTLSPEEDKQFQARPLPDIRAYEYYLKAKHEILTYSAEALDRALAYLEEGEELVGSNALLLATKGHVYWQYVNAGISTDPTYLENAKDCGARAQALDPDSLHAARLLGLIAAQEGDLQRSVRLLKQCVTRDPNDSDSLSWYCALCALSGKAHAVLPLGRRIAEIDPLTPVYRFIPGLLSLLAGEFEDAVAPLDQAIRLDPANAMLQWCRGQALALCRCFPEAIAQFDAMQEQFPGQFFTELGAFMAAALARDTEAALILATPELKERVSGDPHYSWAMAQGYAILGKSAQAIDCLENAMAKGFLNYPMVNKWDPLLDSVRRDSRFLHLLHTLRGRWESFEV
jgi:serine/threonine protein kinase/tetratricopeptide (TPR) repeat protein